MTLTSNNVFKKFPKQCILYKLFSWTKMDSIRLHPKILFPHLCFPQSSVGNSNSTTGILSKRRKWRENDGWRRIGETHLELRLNGGRRRESTDWRRLESWKWEIGFQFPEKLWCTRHRICFVQRKDERMEKQENWKMLCSLCSIPFLLKFQSPSILMQRNNMPVLFWLEFDTNSSFVLDFDHCQYPIIMLMHVYH